MENKFVIPEGSKVVFELQGCGSDGIIKRAEIYKDMEVLSNAIVIIEGGLYCTDNINPVKKINDNEFKIIVWLQDAYVVKESYFYSSLSDAE